MINVVRQWRYQVRLLAVLLALVFGVAPGLSLASGSAVGAFAKVLVHSHTGGDHDHAHPGQHHEHHDDVADHDDAELASGGSDQALTHVHYDVSCPSVLLPLIPDAAQQCQPTPRLPAFSDGPLQGAPPGNLLRPPIRL